MYVGNLIDTEKKDFILLLFILSSIDGDFSEQEAQFINNICEELGIVVDKLLEEYRDVELRLPDILNKFETPISQHTVLIELINLAHIDQRYSDEEKKGIRYIANEMGVDESKVIEIEKWREEGIELEKWAQKKIAWNKKGLSIIAN